MNITIRVEDTLGLREPLRYAQDQPGTPLHLVTDYRDGTGTIGPVARCGYVPPSGRWGMTINAPLSHACPACLAAAGAPAARQEASGA